MALIHFVKPFENDSVLHFMSEWESCWKGKDTLLDRVDTLFLQSPLMSQSVLQGNAEQEMDPKTQHPPQTPSLKRKHPAATLTLWNVHSRLKSQKPNTLGEYYYQQTSKFGHLVSTRATPLMLGSLEGYGGSKSQT